MTRRQSARLRGLVVFLIAIVVVASPHLVSAQRTNRFAFGLGVGRVVPLRPLASDAGQPDYQLDDAGAAIIAIDYWFTNWLATRASYQWVRTNMAKPEGPSFARVWSGYAGALIAPITIGNRVKPYGVLGAGFRRYDVSAGVFDADTSWNISQRQSRFAGYGGLGIRVRTRHVIVVPEAGTFFNTFRHSLACANCGQRDRQLDLILALQVQIQ